MRYDPCVVLGSGLRLFGSNPTLLSPTANSPCMAVTGIRAKEGFLFYVSVIAAKSICGIFTTPCHIGYSLSDTKERSRCPSKAPRHNALLDTVFQAVGGSWLKCWVWAIFMEARWSELSCHLHGQNPSNGTTIGSRYPTRRL